MSAAASSLSASAPVLADATPQRSLGEVSCSSQIGTMRKAPQTRLTRKQGRQEETPCAASGPSFYRDFTCFFRSLVGKRNFHIPVKEPAEASSLGGEDASAAPRMAWILTSIRTSAKKVTARVPASGIELYPGSSRPVSPSPVAIAKAIGASIPLGSKLPKLHKQPPLLGQNKLWHVKSFAKMQSSCSLVIFEKLLSTIGIS